MAGKIKKGFFFYFGMFMLLLITIFLVCLVIMIFNPNKTVLWMQYFTGNETYKITKTSGDNSENINWNSITDIKIVAPSFAKVTVNRNNDIDYADSGIYIRNYAKGFRGATGAVQFNYNVSCSGTSLTLKLDEPNGFLFFSKDLEVIIHSSSLKETEATFYDVNLIIQGGDGDVDIGGGGLKSAKDVKLASLYVKTNRGNISLTENFDSSNLKNNISLEGLGVETPLYLQTKSGNMYSYRTIEYTYKGQKIEKSGIKLNSNCNNARFETENGKLYFDAIVAEDNKNVNIVCQNGVVVNKYIKANTLNVNCSHGNYNFEVIDGNVDFSKSEDNIISPNVIISYITGSFVLTTDIGNQGEPDVEIGEICGNVNVLADRGHITIHKANSGVIINSRNDLKINVNIAKENTSQINLRNHNAETILSFMGTANNTTEITSVSAKIIINVTSSADFTATSYNLKEGLEIVDENEDKKIEPERISINNFSGVTNEMKNPFVRGKGTGKILIGTSSTVEFNLVQESDFLN